MKCLVCKLSDVGENNSYDICSICGRENDDWGLASDEFGGANYYNVNDHRELWKLNGNKPMLIGGVTLIDKLAGFIEEGLGIDGRGREISMEEYQTVADECKRLLRQPNFDITTDIERRAREHPTTPSASSWIELKSYWEKP